MLLQITFRVLICQDDGQPSDILHTFRPFSSIQTKVKVLKPVWMNQPNLHRSELMSVSIKLNPGSVHFLYEKIFKDDSNFWTNYREFWQAKTTQLSKNVPRQDIMRGKSVGKNLQSFQHFSIILWESEKHKERERTDWLTQITYSVTGGCRNVWCSSSVMCKIK